MLMSSKERNTMEKRQETSDHLNSLTCLALGRLAHVEDLFDVIIPKAEKLLVEIVNFKQQTDV